MKPNSQKTNPGQQKGEVDGVRLPFRIAAYVSALMCVAALAVFLWPHRAPETEASAEDAQDSREPSQPSSFAKANNQRPAPSANAATVRPTAAAYPEPMPALRGGHLE